MMLTQIRTYRWLKPIILGLFSLSAIGMHLDVHFCKGHVAGISLIGFEQSTDSDSCCSQPCANEDKSPGCCHDTEISASLDYNGVNITIEAEDDDIFDVQVGVAALPNKDITSFVTDCVVPPTTGPPILKIKRHILYQSFLC